MMDLYTSLTRLKQEMNGGALPPMTPLTGHAAAVLDPLFTPGLGSLDDEPASGLRCPVRGCGRRFHSLAKHWNTSHADVGGEPEIRRLLSIPASAPLVSGAYSAKLSAACTANQERLTACRRVPPPTQSDASRAKISRSKKHLWSVNARNLRDRCEAQIKNKLIGLENEIGRAPSKSEAALSLGAPFVEYVCRVYGSWNAALAMFGLEAAFASPRFFIRGNRTPPDVLRNAVLASLRAYHAVHGCLPTAGHTKNPQRSPITPDYRTIQKAMGATSYPEAMRRVASLLNIYGGRYGLPESARAS